MRHYLLFVVLFFFATSCGTANQARVVGTVAYRTTYQIADFNCPEYPVVCINYGASEPLCLVVLKTPLYDTLTPGKRVDLVYAVSSKPICGAAGFVEFEI